MNEMMAFPDTWEEFEKSYGFTDSEEVYTNGSRLISSFRAKQWLDHLTLTEPELKKGKWLVTDAFPHRVYCSACYMTFAQESWGVWEDGSLPRNYCPNCGAKMDGDDEK